MNSCTSWWTWLSCVWVAVVTVLGCILAARNDDLLLAGVIPLIIMGTTLMVFGDELVTPAAVVLGTCMITELAVLFAALLG